MKKWLTGLLLLVLLYAGGGAANASDIFQGRRGPTPMQVDQRIYTSIAEKDGKRTYKTTSTTIIKHWTGDEHGVWGFLSAPYLLGINSQGVSKQRCLGDASLGFGPRGRTNNFHWLTYAGATLPTGELGNKRTDLNLGVFLTQMSNNQKWELDGSLEYKITGVNSKGINPANELAVGLSVGRELSQTFRFAIGPEYFARGADSSLNLRSILRYTPKGQNRIHFEALYETHLSAMRVFQEQQLLVCLQDIIFDKMVI